MNEKSASVCPEKSGNRFKRLLILMVGIIVGQFILYGPCLVGQKILLPLDILALPNLYLPQTPEVQKIVPHDRALADLVFIGEMSRRFAVSEIQAGRWPEWASYQFAGAPFVSSKYSPFVLLTYCIASPVILAWKEMLMAMTAGLGMYLFGRRVLRVSFWPATIIAWCYPLTGFFVFWQGYGLAGPVVYLPWLCLTVHHAIRNAGAKATILLSLVTGLVLTGGALDVAGQVLLTSGLFALWSLIDAYGKQGNKQARHALFSLIAGWGLGFLLATPHVLPLVEYAKTGARMEQRSAGKEERPPAGLIALPQIVMPDVYGSTKNGSYILHADKQGNLLESSAVTYVGVLATLFLMPLAWCSRSHRSINIFWTLLIVVALAWCLNIPGLVAILRSPGLKMFSHNRFVFAASFAILAMAAVGLETLGKGQEKRRWWFWFPTLLLGSLSTWCFYRSYHLPEPITSELEQAIAEGQKFLTVHGIDGVRQVQAWFTRANAVTGTICGLGFIAWLFLWFRKTVRPWVIPVTGVFLVGDLLWFAHDRSSQCDPALYYPRIEALQQIAKSEPGRIVGYDCFPAPLGASYGLCDIRGYDAVDPGRLIDVLALASSRPLEEPSPVYALTQNFIPKIRLERRDKFRFSPILDMLGVRYLVSRQAPEAPITAAFHSDDYWVSVNEEALPRVFIPRHVETVADARERLEKIGSPQFNPREVAYVESPVDLPGKCSGDVKIVAEVPTRMTAAINMETPGLVVLADLWDKGWKAYLDGKPTPILRANHAIRGVVAPAGTATLEFRYEPGSLALGIKLMGFAMIVLIGLGVFGWGNNDQKLKSQKTTDRLYSAAN